MNIGTMSTCISTITLYKKKRHLKGWCLQLPTVISCLPTEGRPLKRPPSPPKAPFSQALMVLVKLMTSALWAKSGINDLNTKDLGRRFSFCSQMQWVVLFHIHGFFACDCWNAGSRRGSISQDEILSPWKGCRLWPNVYYRCPFARRSRNRFTSKAAPVRKGDKNGCCVQALLPARACAKRIAVVFLKCGRHALEVCEVFY